MAIKEWLKKSGLKQLDAQLLLSFVLDKPKEWLLAHNETLLSSSDLIKLDKLKKRRQNNEPIAYILGKKEFYRRSFIVTPDVLIPRPETEQLVEYCLTHTGLLRSARNDKPKKILDVGTGSGCIAITLKLENPKLELTASDVSNSALKIARKNWKQLREENQEIKFVQSNLLENITDKFDVIVANLPYVDKSWPVSPETKYEPHQAIFAPDQGLLLIKKLIDSAQDNLSPSGVLVLELDPASMPYIKKCCKNYNIIHENPFILALQLATDR